MSPKPTLGKGRMRNPASRCFTPLNTLRGFINQAQTTFMSVPNSTLPCALHRCGCSYPFSTARAFRSTYSLVVIIRLIQYIVSGIEQVKVPVFKLPHCMAVHLNTGCFDRKGMSLTDPERNHSLWLPLRESQFSSFPTPGRSLLSTSKKTSVLVLFYPET